MAITILEVDEAFQLLFESFIKKKFSKSLYLDYWGEKDLLPLVRTYLLGYFGQSIVPEAESELPGTLSGYGRIDFLIKKTAITKNTNETEIKKLMKHDGPSVLVLFDFSEYPLSQEEINKYRTLPSLGRGNHFKSPFNLLYYYIKGKRPKRAYREKLNIRI